MSGPRRSSERKPLSLIVSLVAHAAFVLGLPEHDPRPRPQVFDFEVASLPEPPPPPPEPPAEPPPEEPPPPAEPEVAPPPKPKARTPAEPPPAVPPSPEPPSPEPPPPAAPKRFELGVDQIARGSASGVQVAVGTPGGVPGGTGTSTRPAPVVRTGSTGTGQGTGAGGTGDDAWSPATELALERLPETLNVPVISCPAVLEQGLTGTVLLAVQVRKDGGIRRVRILKGMGYGCDAIARKALERAKFKPARTRDGQPADYELRYEYAFELAE